MGGCQQVRAQYSHKEKYTTLYQKKCHICTVEQEVFGNTEGSIKRTKCKRHLRSILKTKMNCSILRTTIFAK